jgi:hypothetical protein
VSSSEQDAMVQRRARTAARGCYSPNPAGPHEDHRNAARLPAREALLLTSPRSLPPHAHRSPAATTRTSAPTLCGPSRSLLLGCAPARLGAGASVGTPVTDKIRWISFEPDGLRLGRLAAQPRGDFPMFHLAPHCRIPVRRAPGVAPGRADRIISCP